MPLALAFSSALALLFLAQPAGAMPLCGGGQRITCVVDGDTFWLGGEKFRLAGVDTPEMDSPCAAERQIARVARDRLGALLNGRIEIRRTGIDRYGRTLAHVGTPSGDAGRRLLAEGLARRWPDGPENWCRNE